MDKNYFAENALENNINQRLAAIRIPSENSLPNPNLNNASYSEQNNFRNNIENLNKNNQQRGNKPISPLANNLPRISNSFFQNKEISLEKKTLPFNDPQESSSRRRERDLRMAAISRYNGIMRRFDIDQVCRIHISKLVSVDPLLDDFYFQVHSARAGNTENISVAAGGGRNVAPLLERGKNHNLREGKTLQDQILKIVSCARQYPKASQLKLQGSLGNVAFQTSKCPRQTLDIPTGNTRASLLPSTPIISARTSYFDIMKAAEDCYSRIIDIELLMRRASLVNNSSNIPLNGNQHEDDSIEKTNQDDLFASIQKQKENDINNIFNFVSELVGNNKTPRIILILSSTKGIRLFPRILRLFSPRLIHQIILDIFTFISFLDVVRKASIPALFAAPCLFREMEVTSRPSQEALIQYINEVDAFNTFVHPAIFAFVAESEWKIVASLILRMLEKNDLVRVCTSKIGLSMLTLLMSRAEILSQESSADGWPKLFPRIFNELQGHFYRFFPLIAAPALGDTVTELKLTDDAIIWHFLALLAMAATPEQQELVVTEVRERILAIVTAGRASYVNEHARRSLKNVNLFLKALGLEGS